jgi:O-methyltransferase domain
MPAYTGLRSLADLATPMAVRVAATLRVADHVAAGRRNAAEIAAATGTHAASVDRLLGHLVTVGLFARDSDGAYAVTAAGDALRDDPVLSESFDDLMGHHVALDDDEIARAYNWSRAGCYVLSAVIHDRDNDPAVAIPRRCAEAAGAGESVLVVENLGTDGESTNTAMDLLMLVCNGGRERGLAALREFAARAGMAVAGVHPVGRRPTVTTVELKPVPGRA